MSFNVPVLDKSDPKVDKLTPIYLPQTPDWQEKKDWFGQTAMMGAGAGMFIKNPLFVWASMIMATVSFVQQEPLRAPKDAMSPWLTLLMSFAGVASTNIQRLMLAPEFQMPVPAGTATP